MLKGLKSVDLKNYSNVSLPVKMEKIYGMRKGSLTLAMGKCLWFSVKIKVCQSSLSSP